MVGITSRLESAPPFPRTGAGLGLAHAHRPAQGYRRARSAQPIGSTRSDPLARTPAPWGTPNSPCFGPAGTRHLGLGCPSADPAAAPFRAVTLILAPGPRSEERRVGKECRARWAA